jgi:3-hydroxyisobutyrate dehydrogenase-like beta-hydroxyacid dehydrogenase
MESLTVEHVGLAALTVGLGWHGARFVFNWLDAGLTYAINKRQVAKAIEMQRAKEAEHQASRHVPSGYN